jgi:hypothetical protein
MRSLISMYTVIYTIPWGCSSQTRPARTSPWRHFFYRRDEKLGWYILLPLGVEPGWPGMQESIPTTEPALSSPRLPHICGYLLCSSEYDKTKDRWVYILCYYSPKGIRIYVGDTWGGEENTKPNPNRYNQNIWLNKNHHICGAVAKIPPLSIFVA